jgi:hypothetical protein
VSIPLFNTTPCYQSRHCEHFIIQYHTVLPRTPPSPFNNKPCYHHHNKHFTIPYHNVTTAATVCISLFNTTPCYHHYHNNIALYLLPSLQQQTPSNHANNRLPPLPQQHCALPVTIPTTTNTVKLCQQSQQQKVDETLCWQITIWK